MCADKSIKYGWRVSAAARCADLLRSRLAIGCDAAVLLRVRGGLGGRGAGSGDSSSSSSGIGGFSCGIGGSGWGIGGPAGCDVDSPDEALVGRCGFAGVGGNRGGIGAAAAGMTASRITSAWGTAIRWAAAARWAADLVTRVVGGSSSSLLLLNISGLGVVMGG